MKTAWDYSELADAYLKRPDYSGAAIDAILSISGVERGSRVCDVGAGVAHLTLMLATRGCDVVAVEPNDAMRENGISRTQHVGNVVWQEGVGEQTDQPDAHFDLVTFGSSFNVCDREAALLETARILKPSGWFACLWNHRQLDDPSQSTIESIIQNQVSGYNYGSRREDQNQTIDASGLFGPVIQLSSSVVHQQSIEECVEAWRSHATLERQAGARFGEVVDEIENYLRSLNVATIEVPYRTNVWVARRT